VVRSFHLTRSGDPETREVKQLQFGAWPDHGVPDHPAPLLQFMKRVRAVNLVESGPVVVHCSAGVGRTGCFIVIDAMLERAKNEHSVDIYAHVTCLRAQRNYMVQVRESLSSVGLMVGGGSVGWVGLGAHQSIFVRHVFRWPPLLLLRPT